MSDLSEKRRNYNQGELTRDELSSDPIIQFERWYQDAERAGLDEPNSMILATADVQGQPSARVVLLKGFSPEGFIFYTNYVSRKGQELAANPQAALLFFWKEMERQVRIEGNVAKISEAESISYFHSRPRGSQISAWASPQSQEIKEHYLKDKRVEVEKRFKDIDPIPLPHHWGGYILKPATIEFWQGRENRYHDRYRYTMSDDASWSYTRLAP